MKENKRICTENHNSLRGQISSFHIGNSSENPQHSGKTENWTFHPPIPNREEQPEEVEAEPDRMGLGCNIISRDVMYCVKMKVRIGTKTEYWKVLMDTGSRLNVVSDTVVAAHLRRPTSCPKITTASEICLPDRKLTLMCF